MCKREKLISFSSNMTCSNVTDGNSENEQKKVFYLTLRGHRGYTMFREISDFKKMINVLLIGADIKNTDLHAYTLLENHYHLMISSYDKSKYETYIRMSYTKYFNNKYGEKGTVGERDFNCVEIKNEEQFLDKLSYILRNAVRHGLCDSALSYTWCSARIYFNDKCLIDVENKPYNKIFSVTDNYFVKILKNEEDKKRFLPQGIKLSNKLLMTNTGYILPQSGVKQDLVKSFFKNKKELYEFYMTALPTEIRNLKEDEGKKIKRLQKSKIDYNKTAKIIRPKDYEVMKSLLDLCKAKKINFFLRKTPLPFNVVYDIIQELKLRFPTMTCNQCSRVLSIPDGIIRRHYW
ncbi:MAG: hypothetical protein WCS34_01755 [Bacteroidales bacterium]